MKRLRIEDATTVGFTQNKSLTRARLYRWLQGIKGNCGKLVRVGREVFLNFFSVEFRIECRYCRFDFRSWIAEKNWSHWKFRVLNRRLSVGLLVEFAQNLWHHLDTSTVRLIVCITSDILHVYSIQKGSATGQNARKSISKLNFKKLGAITETPKGERLYLPFPDPTPPSFRTGFASRKW